MNDDRGEEAAATGSNTQKFHQTLKMVTNLQFVSKPLFTLSQACGSTGPRPGLGANLSSYILFLKP